MVEYKVCRKCNVTKPRTSVFWYQDFKSKDGVGSYCKVCVNNCSKDWQKNNKTRVRSRHNKRRKLIRMQVLDYYGGIPPRCACCGEDQVEFLALDHVNGNGRQHRKSLGICSGYDMYRWVIKSNFPEGFRVLCHNCNMSHGLYGYCPHKRSSYPCSWINERKDFLDSLR